MQPATFEDAVEAVSARDPRYHKDAYLFLRDALEFSVKGRKKSEGEPATHVSAAELLDAFRTLAVKEYGPMSRTVLEYWGVRDCQDVGAMVFRLVEEGIFGKTEDDTPAAFEGGFDFFEAFEAPYLPDAKKMSDRGDRTVQRGT